MRTEITYENYTINKFDTLNWTLKKTEEDVRISDAINEDGEIIGRTGDVYERTVFVGYYPTSAKALVGLVNDRLGEGCEDIKDILSQINHLKESIKS